MFCNITLITFPGSDSESAEEPVVGNVNKFAVVPPGYTGRPKKGHLIFDACFESGKKTQFALNYFSSRTNPILSWGCVVQHFKVLVIDNISGRSEIVFSITHS